MKRIVTIALCTVIALCAVIMGVFAIVVHSETKELNVQPLLSRAYLLTDQAMAERQIDYAERIVAKTEFESGLSIEAEQSKKIALQVPNAGDYELLAIYDSPETNLFENPVEFTVDSVHVVSEMPFLWADDISDIRTDRYGNEIIPGQYQMPYAATYVEDHESFAGVPVQFSMGEGNCTVIIKPQNQGLTLYGVYAVKPEKERTYQEYLTSIAGAEGYAGPTIVVQGEDYRAKTDSSIRGTNVPNSSLEPYNAYVKLINATADKSNKTIGQKLYYEIEVPQDGIYYMSCKYSQPQKSGGCSYRTIEIDGSIPYTELRDVGFAYTGINTYKNMTIGADEPMGVYLTKGVHTLCMKVTAGPVEHAYNELLAIIDEMNETGLELKRVKGNNTTESSGVDTNRTWDIQQYMPDLLDRIDDWDNRLRAVYEELKAVGGAEPAYVADIMLAVQNLERLAEKPREIPNKLNLLSDDSSSAAQLASLTLSKIYEQNLSIDCIYLHGADAKLPSASARWIDKLSIAPKQFLYSFSEEMNEAVDVENSDGALTVWINKPSQYVEILRQLTAEDFTEKTGIEVSFSIMPDESKITLANSTGSNPDIALGLSYYRPAEFAMRGMAVNLLEFDDFLDWYGKEYNLEALSPMAYEDGIYGASETQDFYVLFYRKDILNMLGLEVPQTWEDVEAMMPVLHRNAMNFNLPLANNVGYKSFEATGGFIFQNGGDYYADDGFSANFGDPNTIRGLRSMVDLYQVYGLAQNIPNFFNAFRSGTVPIGVSNFATYLQLQVGAPELNGRWDIALVPGTKQENGDICRYWSADTTSAMIFANTQKKTQAYEFLKWWLSSETQLRYANDLQMKYGSDYIWNTANHEALGGMSYPLAHKKIILEQWNWQKEALRHPASYILEREVSNAWIAIVTEGAEFQARIDEATINSNREIMRKLTEFGYFDENGNKLKDYNVHLIKQIIAERKAKQ